MMNFVLFIILACALAVVKGMIEAIIFDDDPSFNAFFNKDCNEYHIYRACENAFVYLILPMLAFLIGVGGYPLSKMVFFLLGTMAVADFIFERTYNLYFERWVSPYPFKIGEWSIERRWWFPLIELIFGMGLLWLSA